ncbi:MAG TPA: two-component regulator propeller domain-containing protein [Cytophagales bacterium]|nr:two-component regulator propeller domain-containing protein [Cytophagales bacterium]
MRFKFLLVFLVFCLSVTARSPVFGQEKNIRFKHISYKDGLIQSPISSMLQDKSGYIWIGNWSGLSRYDGATFRNFRQSDTSKINISHNRVNKVYEDKKGNLWIGTSGGLNLYDKKTKVSVISEFYLGKEAVITSRICRRIATESFGYPLLKG